MKENRKRKLALLVIVPFIVSSFISILLIIGKKAHSSTLMSITTVLLRLWGFAGILFWFYVGKQFGKLEMNKVKSFILGNSLWLVSVILYIWQFIILNDVKRNFLIARISQLYSLGFIGISTTMVSLFTYEFDGNMVSVFSYITMLIVFQVGFTYTPKIK